MSHPSWRRVLCSCILAAVPSGLYAVDGVVLIDQNAASAGNVTPGDAPGFPVTISKSGSYRLSGNLTIPDSNTTAVEISGRFVTLDLNGFSIIGPTTCTGLPAVCTQGGGGDGIVNRPGALRVTVRNGTIHGMGERGIDLSVGGTVISNIENVTADSNGSIGIQTFGTVINSIATENGTAGIFSTTVRDSIAEGNGDVGIDVSSGVATGNSAFENGGSGIHSLVGTVIGNNANSNKKFGIDVQCPSSVVGNTTVGNTSGGINTFLTGCQIANNATDK